ncbi:MAG: hypothetical protein WCO56_26015 [Verrucomicrobiota bacterium]
MFFKYMRFVAVVMGLLGSSSELFAWDYTYHRVVNQIALAALPKEFPDFIRNADVAERIAFLSGEPDRWRNSPENTFKHVNGPDHYMDLEDLELVGLTPDTVSPFRHVFTAQLAAARTAHADRLPAIGQHRNSDKTRELSGLLPWTINEYYGKLKSQFSYLKTFEELGTPEEIANARQNTIYIMGVMGHFVGDATQPLHTTKHFNGWVGPNPQGYTTDRGFHQQMDSGYLNTVGLDTAALLKQVQPAKALRAKGAKEDELFPDLMRFLLAQGQLVETVYRVEKAGQFSGAGENGLKGREFLAAQLLKAGQELGDLWLTAWQQAGEDTFLRDQLRARKTGRSSKSN